MLSFSGRSKFNPKSTSSRSPLKSQKSAPRAPGEILWFHFWSSLGPIGLPFRDDFANGSFSQKTHGMHTGARFILEAPAPQNPKFRIDFRFRFRLRSRTPPGPPFGAIYVDWVPKIMISGSPLGPTGSPNCSPKRTRETKSHQQSNLCTSAFTFLEPSGAPEASRGTQGLIFRDCSSMFAKL